MSSVYSGAYHILCSELATERAIVSDLKKELKQLRDATNAKTTELNAQSKNTTGPWLCPVCQSKTDTQEVRYSSGKIGYELWCHGCASHITLRVKT